MIRRPAYPPVGSIVLVLALGASPPARGAEPGRMAPAGGGETPEAVGTAFTYQGFLTANGTPASGTFDFRFVLFTPGGTQVGSFADVGDVGVAAGVFTARVDFGPGVFGADERRLEVRVRPGASASAYTILAPRQRLTGAPVALSLPNVFPDEATNFVGIGRDFRISGNEVFGIRYEGSADQYGGMYVETSDPAGWPFYGYATDGSFRAWSYYNGTEGDWYLYNAGIRLRVPNEGGLRIGPSADYSLVIENSTGSDGVRIFDTADDAIQIGSDPDYSNYGVYIPSPGVSTYGLWPNTSAALGEWALFTVDNIEAGNVFAAGHTQIARVAPGAELLPGDLVVAVGAGVGAPGTTDLLPTVAAADGANGEALIGVVRSRMLLTPMPGKGVEDLGLNSVGGAAVAGDFVAVTVRGVALVRVEPAVPVEAGQRLTAAAEAGRARPLRTRQLDGMLVREGAPVLGVALGPSNEDDVLPVYVHVQ